jgi:hypothetical protein
VIPAICSELRNVSINIELVGMIETLGGSGSPEDADVRANTRVTLGTRALGDTFLQTTDYL